MITLTTLVDFNITDGQYPTTVGLITDTAGDLFGTTDAGGTNGDGTVFELVNNGGSYTLVTLLNFDGVNGAYPQTTLLADAAGDLFGTTALGGTDFGTVFELVNNGGGYTPVTLLAFSGINGSSPSNTLIADAAGDLFGTADAGGPNSSSFAPNGDGTVFELVNSGGGNYTPVTLLNFDGANGVGPYGGLIADAAGDLFGTTQNGGTNNAGTVFELMNSGGGSYTPVTLFSFNFANGAIPGGGLTADAAGDLFGEAFAGGANGDGLIPGGASGNGTVFELVNNGGGSYTLNTLLTFNGANGSGPSTGLITDAAGDLFGTTATGGANDDGTVFVLEKQGSSYTPITLFSFNGADGALPYTTLLADAAGDFFGTTRSGGPDGNGTVFELSGIGPNFEPGPTVANGSLTEGHGQTADLTALINGLITPGLPGDTETLTNVTAAHGTAALGANNTVTYTAPATGPDTILFTVQDQSGDTATGQVAVTVDPGPTVSLLTIGAVSSGQTVKIGTVIQGLRGDSLTLVNPSGPGLSLSNNQVFYTVGSAALTNVSFQIQDGHGDLSPLVTVIIGTSGSQTVSGPSGGYADISLGNGNPTVTLSGSNNAVTTGNGNSKISGGQTANTIIAGNGSSTVSLSGSNNSITLGNGNASVTLGGGGNAVAVGNGNSTISLGGGGNKITAGNGNDSITLAGSGSTVTLGNGTATVHGGTGDTINLATTTLTLYGTAAMVFFGTSSATVNDFSIGSDFRIGPTSGVDVLSHFASDPGGIVDLLGGIGGFTRTAAVLSALKSDGQGGTLLTFGHGSSLDFAGVAPSQLHASNFQIG